jgi:hypothetical protein
MTESCTIHIFLPAGDPEGAKIVMLMNWTGVGIVLLGAEWSRLTTCQEFKRWGRCF